MLLCSLKMNVFSSLSKKGTVQSLPNDLLWLRLFTQSMFFEYFLILCGMNSPFSLLSRFLNIFEPFFYRLIKFARVDELFSVGQALLYQVTASLHIFTILSACAWVNIIPVSCHVMPEIVESNFGKFTYHVKILGPPTRKFSSMVRRGLLDTGKMGVSYMFAFRKFSQSRENVRLR